MYLTFLFTKHSDFFTSAFFMLLFYTVEVTILTVFIAQISIVKYSHMNVQSLSQNAYCKSETQYLPTRFPWQSSFYLKLGN